MGDFGILAESNLTGVKLKEAVPKADFDGDVESAALPGTGAGSEGVAVVIVEATVLASAATVSLLGSLSGICADDFGIPPMPMLKVGALKENVLDDPAVVVAGPDPNTKLDIAVEVLAPVVAEPKTNPPVFGTVPAVGAAIGAVLFPKVKPPGIPAPPPPAMPPLESVVPKANPLVATLLCPQS